MLPDVVILSFTFARFLCVILVYPAFPTKEETLKNLGI